MTLWNTINGALLLGAAYLHIANLNEPDFAKGLVRIDKFNFAAIAASSIGALCICVASFMPSAIPYQGSLFPAGFGLLSLGLGFRYQVGQIYHQREEAKVAEAMAKYMEEVTKNITDFANSLLKLPEDHKTG